MTQLRLCGLPRIVYGAQSTAFLEKPEDGRDRGASLWLALTARSSAGMGKGIECYHGPIISFGPSRSGRLIRGQLKTGTIGAGGRAETACQ
jgi:hypothetical protein